MASGAVKTAIDLDAKVIVVFSSSGRMASYIAKFRPRVSCLMLTPDLVAARQASGLLLGTHTVQVDSLEKTEELIEEVNYELVQSGDVEPGDTIVVVAGRKAGMREQLRIIEVTEGKSYGHFVKDAVEIDGAEQGLHFSRDMLLKFGTSVRRI
jgi:pyruvate kinase